MSGAGSMTAQASADMTMSSSMSGASSMSAVYTREISFDSGMSGAGSVAAVYVRERGFDVKMSAAGSIAANLSRFHIDYIEFTGEFRPGDRIVIDSANLAVTINGVNALQSTAGDFFDLALGTNTLTYTDTASSRTVLMRVTYRDKFV
ncbi:hypothetical protein WBG83_15825 [Paenibacillus sp. y28]